MEIDCEKRSDAKELLKHQYIRKCDEINEKDKMLIKRLSISGFDKSLSKTKSNLVMTNESNHSHIERDKTMIGYGSMEKSIELRKKNELERKKYEAELMAMFNGAE